MRYILAATSATFLFALLFAVIISNSDDRCIVTPSMTDAQQQAQRELHRDKAAATVCLASIGPSLVRWSDAGALVCVPY